MPPSPVVELGAGHLTPQTERKERTAEREREEIEVRGEKREGKKRREDEPGFSLSVDTRKLSSSETFWFHIKLELAHYEYLLSSQSVVPATTSVPAGQCALRLFVADYDFPRTDFEMSRKTPTKMK